LRSTKSLVAGNSVERADPQDRFLLHSGEKLFIGGEDAIQRERFIGKWRRL